MSASASAGYRATPKTIRKGVHDPRVKLPRPDHPTRGGGVGGCQSGRETVTIRSRGPSDGAL